MKHNELSLFGWVLSNLNQDIKELNAEDLHKDREVEDFSYTIDRDSNKDLAKVVILFGEFEGSFDFEVPLNVLSFTVHILEDISRKLKEQEEGDDLDA